MRCLEENLTSSDGGVPTKVNMSIEESDFGLCVEIIAITIKFEEGKKGKPEIDARQ